MAQGISGARGICLSVALELGKVPPIGNVVGSVIWGSDSRMVDLVKHSRKAGIVTMSKILDMESGMRREMNAHLTGVQREYAETRVRANPRGFAHHSVLVGVPGSQLR